MGISQVTNNRHFLPVGLGGLLAFLFLLASTMRAEAQLLDGVAAIVDDEVVLLSELRTETELIRQQLLHSQNHAPPQDVLARQVLERLILDKLQLAISRRADARISESELNQAIERIAQGQGLTAEALYAEAAADGLSREWLRNKVRDEMLVTRVQQSIINRRINVSEQEIQNFLSSEAGQALGAEEVRVGHILLPLAPAASDGEVNAVQETAEALREQVLQGEDFAQLAVLHSAGQNALSGGDLGWRTTNQLPVAFAVALRDLSPGQVTAPIRTDAGIHLLQLHERRGQGERVLRQSRVRHILIEPNQILPDDQALATITQLRDRIIGGESFADLAREFSDDTGSALKGGDLGWSLPGKFVAEFQAVAEEIPVEQISEPFKTQFGWHILQVTERRDQDFSAEILRNQAEHALRQRKFSEELEVWLRELRDEAFVEIKI